MDTHYEKVSKCNINIKFFTPKILFKTEKS